VCVVVSCVCDAHAHAHAHALQRTKGDSDVDYERLHATRARFAGTSLWESDFSNAPSQRMAATFAGAGLSALSLSPMYARISCLM
jgi:hypothetical protein